MFNPELSLPPEAVRPLRKNQPEREEGPIRESSRLEIAPISERFLESFYSSPRFWAALRGTWRAVEKSRGRELGFSFWKDLCSDSTWLTKPHGGEFDNETNWRVGYDEMLGRLRKQAPDKKVYILGKLHFHPDLGGDPVVIPSGTDGDLGVSADDRVWNGRESSYDIPTMEMIVARTTAGTLNMLVYQEPLTYMPLHKRFIAQEIDDTLDDLLRSGSNQDEVLDALRHYGYRAESLRSVNNTFTEEDLGKLASFAIRPEAFVLGDGMKSS